MSFYYYMEPFMCQRLSVSNLATFLTILANFFSTFSNFCELTLMLKCKHFPSK